MRELKKLSQNGLDIQWWKSTAFPYIINRVKRIPLDVYGKSYWKVRNVDFISVYEEDWDNLIILDACRYDIFKEEYAGPGKLHLKYSRAPYSPKFFYKNFNNRTCHDLVSITANPHHKKVLDDNQFHSVYHLWKTHWDKNIQNVHPEAVKNSAVKANRLHPHKRLMIHFMQPHAPFIGPWAQKNIGIHLGIEHARKSALHGYHNIDTTNPYSLAAEGKIEDADLVRAYRENLKFTLEFVEELVLKLDGKTVITADHGELFGERAWPFPFKKYQHPPLLAKKLLQVPWLVIDSNERREIKSEGPGNDKEKHDTDIEQRLKHLGYK